MDPNPIIASELGVKQHQVNAAVDLIDNGSTVPFVARYRKEATGGLDDTQLRTLLSRLTYLRELNDRRTTILSSIKEQGKLTDALQKQLSAVQSKTELEDLYLPYKPRRRTKAQIAREAGLQPLADLLLKDHAADASKEAVAFINKDIETTEAALEGARQILMEEISEIPELSNELREYFWKNAHLISQVTPDQQENAAKFSDYFEYSEVIGKIPSHRALALLRGQKESVLRLSLELPELDKQLPHPCVVKIAKYLGIAHTAEWLQDTLRWCWRVKLHTRIETDLKMRMRKHAEQTAIEVFAKNLRALLLAAPAGNRATIGLDPGLRTGVKVALTDETGKLLDTTTIYPHAPARKWDQSISELAKLAKKHKANLIAIGNGTASRETDQLAADLIKAHPDLGMQKVIVSEAGASVYSASESAAREMPDIDVSLRGAVSIARRLQDPLAELVKVDPKAIGVGQYQHDVNQTDLMNSLNGVVEDCVNSVGVDLNSASAELLSYVSGLSESIAKNIIAHRESIGRYATRKELLKVPRLGPKAFEQCAGFLRIADGDNQLDASAVHPEAYGVVEKIARDISRNVGELIGDAASLNKIDPKQYTDEQFGVPTIRDILSELEKPGRDPRPEFKTAVFKKGIEKISDLKPDMVLEGVVSNVTQFGAFVDIGVHQDGLVHISALADKFVSDPHDVVATGDVVKVKVLSIDEKRKRIALTMRLADSAKDQAPTQTSERSTANRKPRKAKANAGNSRQSDVGSLGAALLQAQNQRKKH